MRLSYILLSTLEFVLERFGLQRLRFSLKDERFIRMESQDACILFP